MPNRIIRNMVENQTIIRASAQTTVAEAASQMKQACVGTVMVIERDQLVGIFTERDALFGVLAEGRDAKTTRLAEVMTINPQTIKPDKPFGHALHMMYEGGFRHLPVVENGWPIGMVSARDTLVPEMQEFAHQLFHHEHIAEILA
ncbi:cyclic nucleotide-binding/CBS domain-containing protein [Propionivibrio sp.]|uniref:CBS domain-containing protein n=1 Tax=Propionivibrio sp. TaxID=2212460 RepID=UPI003BF3BB9D